MKPSSDNWDNFVEGLRSDIMLHLPMKQREEKHTETWEELMSRLRFEIEHPDRELLTLLADKDAEIERLKEQVAALQQQLKQQPQTADFAPAAEAPDYETCIYEQQLQQAQQFVNENSKADVSRLRDLLRKIMPAELHHTIDDIKEAKAYNHYEINGGNNQILPNAKVGIQF